MHHCLFHVFPSLPSTTTNPSFLSAIHTAAARAWSRCYLPNTPTNTRKDHNFTALTKSPPKAHIFYSVRLNHQSVLSSPIPDSRLFQFAPDFGHERVRGHHSRSNNSRSLPLTRVGADAYDVRDEDVRFVDPYRAPDILASLQDYSYSNHIPGLKWVSYSPLTRGEPFLHTPKSKARLYDNLLYLIIHGQPIPGLPGLIDYHDLYPGLHSAQSYNLLLGLALRHASHGTARWLFNSMRALGIPWNLQTWRLRVRYLVQIGQWRKAFRSVKGIPSDLGRISTNFGRSSSRGSEAFPLLVWLELFRSAKRRRRFRFRRPRNSNNTNKVPPILAHPAGPNSLGSYAFRYRLLLENPSLMTPETLSKMSPRVVYNLVWILLRTGDEGDALSMTKTYFTSLPPTLSQQWAQICLGICHLHLIYGSQRKGLPKLFSIRRTFYSLLKLNRSIVPTSTTLLLQLAPLRHAKRCGTIALEISRGFKKQWGAEVLDRRVRRRVASLAIKEGRMDIVQEMMEGEEEQRVIRRAWQKEKEVLGGREEKHYRKLVKAPERLIFRQKGREEHYWRELERRAARKKEQEMTKN